MPSNENPTGGLVMDMANAPPPPPPPLPSGQETVVVPAAGNVQQTNPNPYIPQGVVPSVGTLPQSGGPNPWPKRLLLLVVFLFMVLGAVIGGKYVLGLLAGSKEVTLTYWGLWESENVLSGVIRDFEAKNPKIKIQYVKQLPREYRQRVQAAINRGDGPDIFRFHNTWVSMLKNELAIVPQDVMSAIEFKNKFYPVAANDLIGGNSIYGIPLMIEGLGLYFNEDLFAAAGVTPPTTWEEVLSVVPKVTVKSGTNITTSGIALGTAGNVEHFSDILATMMLQNGANLLDISSKEAEETMIFYRKFSDPNDPLYSWNETMDLSVSAFANGKVAMILAPSWRAFDIQAINPNMRFKVAPIPQLPGNTVSWASYWVEGVSSKSKSQKQAWEFLKYLTSREVATKLYSEEAKLRLFGEPYAQVELGTSIQDDPFVGAFIKQATTARSFPLASRTFDNGLNDKLIKYLEDAVNAVGLGTAPKAALTTAANGFRQVLSSYGLTSGVAAGTQ